ncbi:MAG: hypothetical protein R2941_12290 [Desulfobacterales bacterium]
MKSSLAKRETQRYTYADYLRWPQNERWEIIEGRAWNMCPAPATQHQRISMHLVRTDLSFSFRRRL